MIFIAVISQTTYHPISVEIQIIPATLSTFLISPCYMIIMSFWISRYEKRERVKELKNNKV